MSETFWVETLGCPKNDVDSEKLVGMLSRDGLAVAADAAEADLVVVNTCAFVEAAREESIETILGLDAGRKPGSRLVVTGCMAERYGSELAEALPEVDAVAGFGRSFNRRGRIDHPELALNARDVPDFDLLNLPRPAADRPWAYVKVAEGCDRKCGFCAIPSFRGPQRSRSADSIIEEVETLGVREVVLVAQDLARYGRDIGNGPGLEELVRLVSARVDRVRLLYLYPSELTGSLVETVLESCVPYFDLSLQHVSRPLMRRMRRWGDGDRFLGSVSAIRSASPEAAFRSSFIVGYPGETEDDHQALLDFILEADLDWYGLFPFSNEQGTLADRQQGHLSQELALTRLAEASEVADGVMARKRERLIGSDLRVLVDVAGQGRSHREAPEIDGVVLVDEELEPGTFHDVRVTGAVGADLVATDEELV